MAEEVKEPKIIDTRKKVKVYATKKDKFHEEGEAFEVTEVLADHLVSKGLVTKTAPAAAK